MTYVASPGLPEIFCSLPRWYIVFSIKCRFARGHPAAQHPLLKLSTHLYSSFRCIMRSTLFLALLCVFVGSMAAPSNTTTEAKVCGCENLSSLLPSRNGVTYIFDQLSFLAKIWRTRKHTLLHTRIPGLPQLNKWRKSTFTGMSSPEMGPSVVETFREFRRHEPA
jgi:hypothetical protein